MGFLLLILMKNILRRQTINLSLNNEVVLYNTTIKLPIKIEIQTLFLDSFFYYGQNISI